MESLPIFMQLFDLMVAVSAPVKLCPVSGIPDPVTIPSFSVTFGKSNKRT